MKTKIAVISTIITIAIILIAYTNFFKGTNDTRNTIEKDLDSQISELMKY